MSGFVTTRDEPSFNAASQGSPDMRKASARLLPAELALLIGPPVLLKAVPPKAAFAGKVTQANENAIGAWEDEAVTVAKCA